MEVDFLFPRKNGDFERGACHVLVVALVLSGESHLFSQTPSCP